MSDLMTRSVFHQSTSECRFDRCALRLSLIPETFLVRTRDTLHTWLEDGNLKRLDGELFDRMTKRDLDIFTFQGSLLTSPQEP